MDKLNKQKLTLVFIGHVDSGKSTTAGHLFYKNGGINKQAVEKLKIFSKEIGKESMYLAHIMHKARVSREDRITSVCTYKQFESSKKYYNIIDTPGHRDFLENMIIGTLEADAAIIIIPAPEFEFYASISSNGSARDHILLAHTLGVKHLIFAINKMDDQSVNYSEEKYNQIVNVLKSGLKKIGSNLNNVQFLPISGLTGENLIEKSENLQWFKGLPLIQVCDNLTISKSETANKPLRIPIQEIYQIKETGTIPCGQIETGILKLNTKVIFSPSGAKGEIKSIECNGDSIETAEPEVKAGFYCGESITNKSVSKGDICGELENDPPKPVVEFTAQITILEHPATISVGYTPVIKCNIAQVPCKFTEIISKIDLKANGAIIEDKPKSLKKGDSAFVRLVPQKQICIEPFSEYPSLGRFIIKDMKLVIAVGIVQQVVKGEYNIKEEQ